MTTTHFTRSARLAAGAVLGAAAVAAIGALVLVGLPAHVAHPVVISAQPPASASVSTCAGPVLAVGRDSTQASLLTDAAPPSVTVADGSGGAPEARTLDARDVSSGAGPASYSAPPTDGKAVDLSAAASASAAADDLAGFAASACGRSAMESWLVAGSASTGAADLIVLANPGAVAARVNLRVFGASGASDPQAGQNLVIAPGTQRVIPLAAIALGEEFPIVRVSASQAPVQAFVQTSLTRILATGGIDQVAAVAAPDSTLVIPGVHVAVSPDGTGAGASDVPTRLRLLAPAAAGTATVEVTGPSGAAMAPRTVAFDASIPLQLDLDGLDIGTYTVSVHATTPVTGAVWATTGFDAASDFAWFTPAAVIAAPTLAAVAAGPNAELSITADASGSVAVEPVAGGERRDIAVEAGGTVTVPVAAGAVYRLVPEGIAVRAAVTYHDEDALAGFPVPPGDAEASAVRVYPR